MYDSVGAAVLPFQTAFEGRIEYLYLDVRGLVTIGVGNLIDDARDAGNGDATRGLAFARPLPFVWKTDDSAADQDAIDQDWTAVKTRQDLAARGAGAFASITQLKLDDGHIDDLVRQKADEFEATLKRSAEFAGFDDMPADAQLGLLSMAWAMGPAFAPKFPRFASACQDGRWGDAADQCHIAGPGLGRRNDADRMLFLNAAQVAADGGDYAELVYQVG
ncbi:MAG: hypothetical protein V7603_4954 [Micromonosporaceae bacterium]